MFTPVGMSYEGVAMSLAVIDAPGDMTERARVAMQLLVSLAGTNTNKLADLRDLRVRLEDHLVYYRHVERFLNTFASLKSAPADNAFLTLMCALESPCLDFDASSLRRILCGLQARDTNMAGTVFCHCRNVDKEDVFAKEDAKKTAAVVVPSDENSRVVTLTRGATGLDMKIRSFDGVFHVVEALAGGVAAASGAVRTDDRIIAINDIPVTHKEHDVVVRLLTTGATVRLHLIAEASSRIVDLTRGVTGFGMKIASRCGVFRVVEAMAGGVAAASGAVRAGDRIIAINDVSVKHEKHEVVVRFLRTAPTVRLHLIADASALPPLEDFVDDGGSVSWPGDTAIVHVKRGADGIGMGIRESNGDYYVSSVGGAAKASGAVRTNDRIIAVNGTFTAGRTVDEVVGLLTAADITRLHLNTDRNTNRVITHL